MDLQLKDKRALVTGSTAGIGLAAARLLHAEGAQVIINGRKPADVDARVAELGAGASGLALDLGTAEGCRKAKERLGEVDILINNMGIYEAKAFFDIPDEDWLRFYEVNVLSGVRLSRAFLPGMLTRNWGRILFVSSESALNIPTEMIHYGMSKTAMLSVSRGLAQVAAGTGVTVNAVLPGPTMSEGVRGFVEQLARDRNMTPDEVERDFFASTRPSSLLKRFTSVEEIAAMLVYLCSPLASATTGAAVRADGGVVASLC